jgi:hypothetical protein
MTHKLNGAGARRMDSRRQGSIAVDAKDSTHVVTMEVSPAFVDFLEKLRDFEYLIDRGDYYKAAIMGGDIQMTLDRFDPRLYFPAILSRFSELFHEHGKELAEHVGDRESFRWKSHLQFYRVDRETFVRGRKLK